MREPLDRSEPMRRPESTEPRQAIERPEPNEPPEAREDPMLNTPASERMSMAAGETGGLTGYRRRFDELQSEFIEHPKEAVEKAESLVEEAVDAMMNSLQERVRRVHSGIGEGADTERLRVAMRDYKDLIDSLDRRL